jgi:hypothetical protein
MTESWPLNAFIIGSVILMVVPLIACIKAKRRK